MSFKDKGSQDEDDFYKTSKLDIVLILFVIFVSAICIQWFNRSRFQQSSGPRTALIYQENKLLEEVSLGKDGIITLLNGRMEIEVKNGKIKVIKTDCPQHICANSGWIQYSGQTIVCAPNKVLIEIASKGSPLLDAVVY